MTREERALEIVRAIATNNVYRRQRNARCRQEAALFRAMVNGTQTLDTALEIYRRDAPSMTDTEREIEIEFSRLLRSQQ